MTKSEQTRLASWRLKILQRAAGESRNVARICRYFGISRKAFYKWKRRYLAHGEAGLRSTTGPRSEARSRQCQRRHQHSPSVANQRREHYVVKTSFFGGGGRHAVRATLCRDVAKVRQHQHQERERVQTGCSIQVRADNLARLRRRASPKRAPGSMTPHCNFY